MLISTKYSFLFIHIPKVAGSSIENSLREATLSDSEKMHWQIDSILKKLNYRIKFYSGFDLNIYNPFFYDPWQPIYDKLKTRHARANRIREAIGTDTYENLFKFAFVRNPWSRLVSQYEYILQTKHHKKRNRVFSLENFENFLKDKIKEADDINQSKWLVNDNYELIVDFVGKLEDIEQDYKKILKKIGLGSNVTLKKVNRSKKKRNSYRDYYTEYTKNLVYEHASHDIYFFDYDF